jgi:sigma-E factor negative regulatory protein RseC
MLGGALLAQAVQPGDGAALAGMLIGGAVGWLLARGGRTARPVVLRRENRIPFQVMKGQS